MARRPRANPPSPEELRALQEQRRKNREAERAVEPTEAEKQARAELKAAARLAQMAPESRELLLKKERRAKAPKPVRPVKKEDAATVKAGPEREASDG